MHLPGKRCLAACCLCLLPKPAPTKGLGTDTWTYTILLPIQNPRQLFVDLKRLKPIALP